MRGDVGTVKGRSSMDAEAQVGSRWVVGWVGRGCSRLRAVEKKKMARGARFKKETEVRWDAELKSDCCRRSPWQW